jgi:ATP-dependent DNA helicase RecG
MTRQELLDLITELQRGHTELSAVEAKNAGSGTPKRLYESLSALSNRSGGGAIVFGLNETKGFEPTGVGDAKRLQEEVSSLASSEMEPPVRLDFRVEHIDGATVVAVEIPETPTAQKPCFYKPAGLQKGSYIRVGNTNRPMTDYEIFGFVSSRGQPTADEEPVVTATAEDLDRQALERYVGGLREARPGAKFLNGPIEGALKQLGILGEVGGIQRPTVAGLLVFGSYPQAHEPQLVITFLQFSGTTESEKGSRGERFLDNRKFEGPIPVMIEEATRHVSAAFRKSSLITGLYRRDIPEYPGEAVREAIVNAVVHRDYSAFSRGSYIQVRLFADRLEVQSPGGLHGSVTVDSLESEQSTRNRILMKLMEDLHLVENRGSGVAAMISSMHDANLEPPRFEDRRSSFWVTFRNHTLMNPEMVRWLNQFAGTPMNDRQRLALAYLRQNEKFTNSDYRRVARVDPVVANRELRGLIQTGLVDMHETRRWASYSLKVSREAPAVADGGAEEERIVAYVRKRGSISNTECRRELGVSRRLATRLLAGMKSRGLLIQVGERRWTRYRLA